MCWDLGGGKFKNKNDKSTHNIVKYEIIFNYFNLIVKFTVFFLHYLSLD